MADKGMQPPAKRYKVGAVPTRASNFKMIMKCDKCNAELKYSRKYDARYCPICNIWTESKCKDKECIFCPNRPETPRKNVIMTIDKFLQKLPKRHGNTKITNFLTGKKDRTLGQLKRAAKEAAENLLKHFPNPNVKGS